MRCRSLRSRAVDVVQQPPTRPTFLSKGKMWSISILLTKTTYSSYYHLLETITLGDRPQVEGVSGLRPWRDKASPYCYKAHALKALRGLIAGMASVARTFVIQRRGSDTDRALEGRAVPTWAALLRSDCNHCLAIAPTHRLVMRARR